MRTYKFESSRLTHTIRAADGRYLLKDGNLGYYDDIREYRTLESAERALKRFPKELQDALLKAKAVIVRDMAVTAVVQPVTATLSRGV